MARRKWKWTELQIDRADKVLQVVNELEDYWPLTLRQIYYRLVSNGSINNTRSHYNMLSKLVKWMRIDDKLEWDVLEDRTRTLTDKRGYESPQEYIDEQLQWFLRNYSRCLVQGQGKYIEVWTEKDALFRIFEEVVWPYCMRAVVCRGYDSVTFLADYYKRAEGAIMKGKEPVVLYFGDLDPSGVQMFEAAIETLEDELDLYGVTFKRIGLNLGHISQYQLPFDPTAAKTTDPRYKSYVQRYGRIAVELDALHPRDLQQMIRTAIEAEVDMSSFQFQKTQERIDRVKVAGLRAKVLDIIQSEVMFD